MAHVERDKTVSHKVSPDAFLFKATKGNESNKNYTSYETKNR
jgi:hypothetical protein